MPGALRIRPRLPKPAVTQCLPTRCSKYATAAAVTPAAPIEQIHDVVSAIERYPPMQPPSHKPPDLRKSQLHRQYTSLLRSTPLTLFFQHNNLTALEWAAIRRELYQALKTTTQSPSSPPLLPGMPDPADSIRLQVLRTSIFAAALRVVEFYDPTLSQQQQQDPPQQTAPIHATEQATTTPTHALSRVAYEATLPPEALRLRSDTFSTDPRAHRKRNTTLHNVLHGPIAALTFPVVTPHHLAAALSILAPTPGAGSAFPAPRRRDSPGYYEPAVQVGLPKLLLLGARVEGRAMDSEGARRVGELAAVGGLEGLRAQLVGLLQGAGMGLTGALEGAVTSLWATVEGRRMALEDEGKAEKGPASS